MKSPLLDQEDLEQDSISDFQEKHFFKRFFNPVSPSEIRRVEFFWAGVIVLLIFCVAYGVMTALSHKESLVDESSKEEPKSLETAVSKVNLNEGYWHKVEEENQKLHAEIGALKTLFEEMAKSQAMQAPSDPQETRLEALEAKLEDLHEKLSEAERGALLSAREDVASSHDAGKVAEEHGIAKFSLGIASGTSKRRTVESMIPAGAFAKTILLSGLDASSAMNSSSDPRPMLLRLIDHGTLPRRFQSDLKDCHCTASAYGDLSSERVYARLEKLTCIERSTGEIIETQVAGYIAGSDGKAGIRGVVASKDGELLSRSLIGGVFAGLSNVANPQNRQSQVNPFFPGSPQVSPPSFGGMFASGMATGATTALDRLSQYYIDRAEQLQPVIQIAAGQVVDIVFTEGTYIGTQNIQSDIAQTRESARSSEESSSSADQRSFSSTSQESGA
jgi:conjugal transfer pilus assembly protein TraB